MAGTPGEHLPVVARRRIRRNAVLAGILADAYRNPAAVAVVGVFTLLSGILVAVRMRGTDHKSAI